MRFITLLSSSCNHSGRVSRRLMGLRLFPISRHFLRNLSGTQHGITMQSSKFKMSDDTSCSVRRRTKEQDNVSLQGYVRVICKDSNGDIKWTDEGSNLVVDAGIDYILGTAILDSATIYVGLTGGSPTPAAGDTMASHGGWTEAAGYDEATRPSWGQDAVSSKVVTNSTAATFTMDGVDTTIGGAFLTTLSTKDGTTGTLIAVKAFTGGNKTVADNDTLDVTYTVTGS